MVNPSISKMSLMVTHPTKHAKEPTDILYQTKSTVQTQRKYNTKKILGGVHASTHRIHPYMHTLSVYTHPRPTTTHTTFPYTITPDMR